MLYLPRNGPRGAQVPKVQKVKGQPHEDVCKVDERKNEEQTSILSYQ